MSKKNKNDEEIIEDEVLEQNDELEELDLSESNELDENDTSKDCSEYEASWKRALADYENLKRNLEDYKQDVRDRVKIDFAQSLLPVMDNFYSAVKFAPEVDDSKINNWLQGVLYIQKQFEEVFSQMGLEQISTVGQQFDPNMHDAVEEKELDDRQDGEILDEVAQGWKMEGRIVRPARVIINSKK